MKFLLDTHVLLWWLSDNKLLKTKAATAIRNGENTIFVSAATAWEISIKRALGKLKAPDDLEKVLASNSFQQLPISLQHGLVAGALPHHHDDPFDRMLIAQAKTEQLTIISHDVRMEQYGVSILWTWEDLFASLIASRYILTVDSECGIRGTQQLAVLVDSGDWAFTFGLYPTTVEELMVVSDADRVMPPKSTWFEPTLRDSLFVHMLRD